MSLKQLIQDSFNGYSRSASGQGKIECDICGYKPEGGFFTVYKNADSKELWACIRCNEIHEQAMKAENERLKN